MTHTPERRIAVAALRKGDRFKVYSAKRREPRMALIRDIYHGDITMIKTNIGDFSLPRAAEVEANLRHG